MSDLIAHVCLNASCTPPPPPPPPLLLLLLSEEGFNNFPGLDQMPQIKIFQKTRIEMVFLF